MNLSVKHKLGVVSIFLMFLSFQTFFSFYCIQSIFSSIYTLAFLPIVSIFLPFQSRTWMLIHLICVRSCRSHLPCSRWCGLRFLSLPIIDSTRSRNVLDNPSLLSIISVWILPGPCPMHWASAVRVYLFAEFVTAVHFFLISVDVISWSLKFFPFICVLINSCTTIFLFKIISYN